MMSDQGWGETSFGGNGSAVLLEVEQLVVTNAECETAHQTILNQLTNESYTVNITEGMICAGGVAGEGTCRVNKVLKSIFDKTYNNKTTGRLRRSSDLQERDPAHSHR